jgi:hypothetical protein
MIAGGTCNQHRECSAPIPNPKHRLLALLLVVIQALNVTIEQMISKNVIG